MKHIARLLSVITVASVVLAQQPTRLEDPPWIKEVATQRIFYTVPGMENIRPLKDLTYKRTPNEELKMAVFQPRHRSPRPRRPAVILIHGGALPSNLLTKPKEWGAYVSLGQLAAASGFVGVTFNHRFYGWDMKSLSDARTDLDDAIAYVRDNADRLGVDKDRICLWSLSAGSVLLGRTITDAPPFVRAVVFYYPIMDLEPLRKDRRAITEQVVREFSPLHRVKETPRAIPPTYIARAGREEPAINSGVDRFIQQAINGKANLDISNHADGQHGFDVLDDNERTREIIQRTIEFIAKSSSLQITIQ